MAKEGSTVCGLMDTLATSVSLALQYGVPLKDVVNKFAHVRFEPSGFTGNPEIPIAKSLVDYIFRWLGSRFLRDGRQGVPRADRPVGHRGRGAVRVRWRALGGSSAPRSTRRRPRLTPLMPPAESLGLDAPTPASSPSRPAADAEPPTATATRRRRRPLGREGGAGGHRDQRQRPTASDERQREDARAVRRAASADRSVAARRSRSRPRPTPRPAPTAARSWSATAAATSASTAGAPPAAADVAGTAAVRRRRRITSGPS